jgi:hypothetical protein
MNIFRVWDVEKDESVSDGLVLMTQSGSLCFMQTINENDVEEEQPTPVYVMLLQEDGSLETDCNTFQTDKNGTEIFQRDILRVQNKDVPPKDAINIHEFEDFIIDFDKSTGKWLCYLWVNDVFIKYGALYKYAKKGIVVGRKGIDV